MRTLSRAIGSRVLRLLTIAVFGLTVGACSKCDVPVPDWVRGRTADQPASCHDTASAR